MEEQFTTQWNQDFGYGNKSWNMTVTNVEELSEADLEFDMNIDDEE